MLLFRIYVENSGAVMQGYPKDYNAARDVTVSVAVDDRAATLRTMTAYVSASNTNPQSVWCNLDLASPRPFRLDLISGSTEVYSNAARDNAEGKASGRTVPDLLSQPLLMGFEEDDGVVLPDYWYAKYIYFEMRVTEVS